MHIDVCTGLSLPFFPMRPTMGRALSRGASIKELWRDAVERELWVMQPKLNGDRACLACVDGKVYVQNRHGSRYGFKVRNAQDFLKLPNRTCFDGEVFKRNFYPFECLASNSHSFLLAEAHERVAMAKGMVQHLGHPWLFDPPSRAWLLRRSANLPDFEGVVLKQWRSRYLILGSERQFNADWLKRRWQ